VLLACRNVAETLLKPSNEDVHTALGEKTGGLWLLSRWWQEQRLSLPSGLPSPKLFGEGGDQVGQVMFRLSKPDELIEREIYFAGVGPREHQLGLPEETLGPRELGGRKIFGHVSRAFRR
jgi:hypothetical protein